MISQDGAGDCRDDAADEESCDCCLGHGKSPLRRCGLVVWMDPSGSSCGRSASVSACAGALRSRTTTASHRDDDRPSGVTLGDVIDGIRVRSSGYVPSITGVTFPASTSSLSASRSAAFWVLTDGLACWRTNMDTIAVRIVAAELAAGVPAAVGDQRPVRREGSPRLRHRVVPDVVEDEVVALSALREVLLGVVDDVVGADRADQVDVPGAGDAGHLGTERLGDLHGERAHAARRPVDRGPSARAGRVRRRAGAGGRSSRTRRRRPPART